jgi:hypothetical protein
MGMKDKDNEEIIPRSVSTSLYTCVSLNKIQHGQVKQNVQP